MNLQKSLTDCSRFEAVASIMLAANDIAIFTHTNMDGDAAGSTVALCLVLRKLGKHAEILLEDDIPEYLAFLENSENPCFVHELSRRPQVGVAVDISQESRLEKRIVPYYSAAANVCIDHHNGIPDLADYYVADPREAASAILIFELIRYLEQNTGAALIDKTVAEALYVGISTDTGCFKYSNANKKCLDVCSELYEYGINHSEICSKIYDTKPLAQMKLEALGIERAEFFAGGYAALTVIYLSDLESTGAKAEYIDTVIDQLRKVQGVEIAAVIKEKEKDVYKLSMRAKDCCNVGDICASFGGGGHNKAAGATFCEPLDSVLAKIKPAMELELKNKGFI